jgi:cysteine desulfurase
VAKLIGADAKEIVFTSGATESNNLAIKGAAGMYGNKGRHFITQNTEHKSVLDAMKYLESIGCRVTNLGVDSFGRISLDALKAAIEPHTVLISIMAANNEMGPFSRSLKSRASLVKPECCCMWMAPRR